MCFWEQKIIVLYGIDAKGISQKNTSENFTERKTAGYFVNSESKNKLLKTKSYNFSLYFINEPKLWYFLVSNLQRKQRNVLAFFCKTSTRFFLFSSVVIPHIMLIFSLVIVGRRFLTF